MTDWLLQRWRHHEKLRFLVIGAWNTVFGYLMFLTLYALLHERVNYLLIAVLAHVIAVINAFVGHRLLVFRKSGSWHAAFIRFNASQLVVLGSGLLGLWLLVSVCGLNPLVAQFSMTVATLLLSYLAHRYFSFAGP